WGVSTRLMGALIMAHSDDEGLVLPPKLAPIQVVIVPLSQTEEQLDAIRNKVKDLQKTLLDKGGSAKFDDTDNQSPGVKFAEYELKGVLVRIAIGPRDLENGAAEVARRDTKTKSVHSFDDLPQVIENLLNDIQNNIYEKALKFQRENTTEVNDFDAF